MKSNISQPFFQISEANIISRGISNGHEYIVYCSDKGVNVNTDLKRSVKICITAVRIMTGNYVILSQNLKK